MNIKIEKLTACLYEMNGITAGVGTGPWQTMRHLNPVIGEQANGRRSMGSPDDGSSAGFGPGSQAALRSANQGRVLELLRSSGELTQAEVARLTGLAPATVSNIVRELTSAGVIDEADSGQRRRRLRLARSAGLIAGVDFGHRHVTVAVANMSRQVIGERRIPLGPVESAQASLERARELLDELLRDIDGRFSDITTIGMGLPAPIDNATGKVGSVSILPGWVGVPAAQVAGDHFGCAVIVDNDANLGVLAEHTWGAGRGCDNLAFLKLADGVGAGLFLDGRLYRGRNGTAGEIGHTTFDEFGAVCRCGNRGCLETIVAARAVVELLEPRHGAGLTIAEVVRLAGEGDTACARVLSDTGRQVGVAVANLCNLFDPQRILIGGELAQAGELLLAPLRESVRRRGIPSSTRDLTIQLAELGPRGPVLGAVALASSVAPEHAEG